MSMPFTYTLLFILPYTVSRILYRWYRSVRGPCFVARSSHPDRFPHKHRPRFSSESCSSRRNCPLQLTLTFLSFSYLPSLVLSYSVDHIQYLSEVAVPGSPSACLSKPVSSPFCRAIRSCCRMSPIPHKNAFSPWLMSPLPD